MSEAKSGPNGGAAGQSSGSDLPLKTPQSLPSSSGPLDVTLEQPAISHEELDLRNQQTLDSADLQNSADQQLGTSDPQATAFFDSKDESGSKDVSWDRSSGSNPKSSSGQSEKKPSNTTHFESNVSIPGFKIIGELGRGAFGVVYRAHDEMLDRNVAIKMPIFNESKYRQQYIDEARKSVRLEHPNIVPTFHVGVTNKGQPFVVQKLIEGHTLRQYLNDRGGALSLGEGIAILRPVFLAIESAHAIGMIHRDLKPDNLLIDNTGRPFVADFGLAVSDEEDLSGRGEIAGTPLYMSPEQFSGKTQWLDGRSDIWALGVIFYEVLVGKVPFYAKSIKELREQIFEKDPRPIHQRQTNIPASFDAIFRKCCAKNTGDRFGSVRELIDAIDQAIEAIAEQGILDVHPDILRSDQPSSAGTIHSNSSSRAAVSTRRQTLTNQTTRDSTVLKSFSSQKVAQLWAIIGPLIAIVCSVVTVGLVYAVLKYGHLSSSKHVSSHSQTDSGLNANIQTSASLKKDPKAVQKGAPETMSILPNMMLDDKSSKPILDGQPNGNSSADPSNVPSESMPEKNGVKQKNKPFRVSLKDENATHTDFQLAVNESAPGDTIYVGEGVYREAIVADKDLRIIGEGERGNITFQSEGKAYFTVTSDAKLQLENVKVKTNRKGEEQANTIDVKSGEVKLNKCIVISNSYNCVKLHEQAKLFAKDSDFQSSEHATIRAEPGAWLEVESCDFILHPDTPDSMKKICIQGEGAGGKIKGCRFKGPCMAGIEWKDQKGELSIQECVFNDQRYGVTLSNCDSVQMLGTEETPLKLVNCENAIWLRNCKGSIEGTQITGNKTTLKRGVAVQLQSDIKLVNCVINGYATGIAVNESKMVAEGSSIQDCTTSSLLLLSGDATLKDMEFVGKPTFHLHVQGSQSTLNLTDSLVSSSTCGIWIESGKTLLNKVTIEDCDAGLIAGVNSEFAKNFSEDESNPGEENGLEKDSVAGADDLPEEGKKVQIEGGDVRFLGCAKGVIFVGPGQLAFQTVEDDFKTDQKKRISTLNKDLLGTGDLSGFRAQRRTVR